MRLNLTIPVYNEERSLRQNMTRLHVFLSQHFRLDREIVIADNGSTDKTLEIAQSLARELPHVRVIHSSEKGRGGALKRAWLESDADILSYMDADLSTEIEAFPRLIAALVTDGYDLATGSRLLNPALTKRSVKREVTSQCYNRLVKALLRTHFSDAQCGFKAITRPAARHLLPMVEDNGWFFDTELLVIGEKLGYRVYDLAVRWVENPSTRVRVVRTALEDLKGLIRVWWSIRCGRLPRFRR